MVLFRATITNLHYNHKIGAHEGRVTAPTGEGTTETFTGRVYLPMLASREVVERAFKELARKRSETTVV